MNFSIILHDWSAFLCIRFVKSCYSGNPVSPKIMFLAIRLDRFTVFMLSVGPKSIFNRSWWYEVDHLWMWALYSSFSRRWVWPKWIFHQPVYSFHAFGWSKVCSWWYWSAFLCIRFVKSCYSGNPVCPKIMFSAIRLDRFTVFMLSVGPKSISNRSWWYEVDYLWIRALYSSFSRRWVWPKWIFHYPCMTEVHFYASGLSKVAIRGIRFVPKSCFQLFG